MVNVPTTLACRNGSGRGQRVVDVGLGGEVHDGVGLGDQLADQIGVGDVALHQSDLVLDRRQRLAAARVGQRIENRHCVFTRSSMDEVGADEPRTASDQQPHGQTLTVRRVSPHAGHVARLLRLGEQDEPHRTRSPNCSRS